MVRAPVAASLLVVMCAAGVARADDASFRAAYERGLKAYDAGDYLNATMGFSEALAIDARPEALYMIARCHEKRGLAEAAIGGYESFLKTAADHKAGADARGHLIDVLTTFGEQRLDAADFGRARAAYERALDIAKDSDRGEAASVRMLAGYGEALAGLGENDGAIAALERAHGAAVTPDLRARIEAALVSLGRPVAAPLPFTSPAPELLPSPEVWRLPSPRKRSRAPVYAGLVAGAVLVVAGGVALAVGAAIARRPELGWTNAGAPALTAAW